MADEDRRPLPRSWIIGGVVAAVAVVAVLLMVGDGDEDAPQGPGHVGGGAPVVDRDFCRRQLEDALEALRPSQLDIRSSADDLAADLNNWWQDCGATDRVDIETDAMSPLLQASVLERVTSDRFDPRDAAHIRDCMLYREIAKRIAMEHDSQLTRGEAAFRFAVRQMALASAGGDQPPLPCQYAALFGRGEAAHRAWLTAEVLRQLSVDCVIIEPAGEGPAADAAAALLGVIVPGEGVYLFDAAAGIAIPGAADDEAADGDMRPATLAEARSQDDLLRRLDVPDGPAYPWTAEQLQDVSVKVIGDSSWWAPRMAGLQTKLPGDFAMTLFDGLTDNPFAAAGLLARVREAGAGGAWNEDDVSVWDFPDAQITSFYATGGEDGAAVADRFRVLNTAPRVLVQQMENGPVVEVDSPHPLRMVRLEQLSGKLEVALRQLGAVRSGAAANPGVVVNQLAKEDAVYWIGLCQYELQREETALGNLDIYLREYPFGVWAASVRALRAHCLARLGQYDEAVQAMLEKSAAGRLSFGEAYRVRQWQANAAAATDEGSARGPEAPTRE